MLSSTALALALISSALAIHILYGLLVYRRCVRLINDFAGYKGFLGPGGKWYHVFLPKSLQGGDTNDHYWKVKHSDHVRYGWDVICTVSWLIPKPRFLLADPQVIQQVSASRTLFPKPVAMYGFLDIYGPNLLSAEGAFWARHRKITAPAFNEANLAFTWEQSVRILNDMFESDWDLRGDRVVLDQTVTTMKDLTLLIIMAAGFGKIDSWLIDRTPASGHSMTFHDSLQMILQRLPMKFLLPQWVWGSADTRQNLGLGGVGGTGWLGSYVRNTAVAFSELGSYFREMIHEQHASGRSAEKQDRRDVFSNLVGAMSDNETGSELKAEDVFGNMFIFLVAGHETTAHTLTFALGLLALEEDEQEKLYAHIKGVMGDRMPSYSDVGRLDQVLAVFYETLRMFPPVITIPKSASQDASFLVDAALSEAEAADPNLGEEKRSRKMSLFVPKGSTLLFDTPGLHHNPRYWDEPYTFKPERFLQPDWPRHAFVPFSTGPRACIGRRFAEVESIATITLIVLRYKLSVDSSRFSEIEGESKLERRNRFLKARALLTTTPEGVPLIFTRR